MTEIPNRKLTPDELKQFKKDQELQKALSEVEHRFIKRAEVPSRWFGRLVAALAVAIFLDITGWVGAFLSGSLYAAFAFLIQLVETLCVVGLAGLAIYGSVEAYRQQEELKAVKADFEGD